MIETTCKLTDGRVVLARRETKNANPYPVTYANMRQAEKKRDAMGEGWCVTGNRPYYVTQFVSLSDRRTQDELDDFDITGKVCAIGTPPIYQGEELWEMYSFNRAASTVWNAIGRGLYARGWTMEEIKDWLQSKEARWALDHGKLWEMLDQVGMEFAKTANKAEE